MGSIPGLRNRARKRWQKYRNPYDNDLRIRIKIGEYKNKIMEEKLSKLTPSNGSLWKVTKFLKKKPQEIPTLSSNSIDCITDEQKTELLAETYEKIHDIGPTNSSEDKKIIEIVENYLSSHSNTNNESKKYHTQPLEIKNIIKNLANNKSPGIDEIDNKLIKNLSKKAIVQLNYIINAIYVYTLP